MCKRLEVREDIIFGKDQSLILWFTSGKQTESQIVLLGY